MGRVITIEDAIDVRVLGFALEAGFGAARDAQERIAGRVARRGAIQRFQPGGRLAPVRKHEALAFGDAAKPPSAFWRNST